MHLPVQYVDARGLEAGWHSKTEEKVEKVG
jgi:hypothetical protein